MKKVSDEVVFAYIRSLVPANRESVIDAATQSLDIPLAKAAMKYLRTVYNLAHPTKSAKHYDETRAQIIQMDEMGTLDNM